jgi:predicted amidohydrolase YtcJ
MDIIFYNGQINTLDASASVYSAVGVTSGIVTALGTDDELRRLVRRRTEVVDLQGAVMFPGFMEAHNHLTIYAYLLDGIDLSPSGTKKMDDILTRVRAEAESTPSGTWIKGSRYAEYFLAENRHPTRYDLDRISPDHPVILYHTSFHACVLNSQGLKAFDIHRGTISPKGGIIEKDTDTGEPTGVLHDQAMMDVFNKLYFEDLANLSKPQRIDLCALATEKYAEMGFVFAADALVAPLTLSIYQDALAADRLKIRVYTMNYEPLAEPLIGSQIKTGFGSPQLRIGPIKLFADGGMSNRTAALGEPYRTPPYDTGLKVLSREELTEKVKRYDTLGYQVAVHAQGDAGISDTLDAFATVLGAKSANPLRHRIEHGGCLYAGLLKRAADMNICISVQPVFFSELGDGFLEAFGPQRANHLYPFKSMLNAGLKIGGSSDCPVCRLDPRLGLRDAILRRSPSGKTLGLQEALSMEEAIGIYTRGAAYLSFDENHNGSIEAGKRADFTVMAADPRAVKPEEVPEIPFTMTVVNGTIVWSA